MIMTDDERETAYVQDLTAKSMMVRDAFKQLTKVLGCKIGSPEMLEKCSEDEGVTSYEWEMVRDDCRGVLFVCIMSRMMKPYFMVGFKENNMDAGDLKPSDLPYHMEEFLPSVRDAIESSMAELPAGEMLVLKIVCRGENE